MAPSTLRRGYHGLNLFELCDIGSIRYRLTASGSNFSDDRFGRRRTRITPVTPASEIVHEDLGTTSCQAKGVRSTKAIARASDDRYPTLELLAHDRFSSSFASFTRHIPIHSATNAGFDSPSISTVTVKTSW